MKTNIRKIGNSSGILIPSIMMKEAGLKIGTEVSIQVMGDMLVIRPIRKIKQGKRELTLKWLLEDFKNIHEDLIPGAVGKENL